MRKVTIIGLGSTKYGKLDRTLLEMANEACMAALEDAEVDPRKIDALYVGNFVSGMLTGQKTIAGHVARSLGMIDIPATNLENACSSASTALRIGYLSVAAKIHDYVLIVGVEKMSKRPTERVIQAVASPMNMEGEGKTGLTFPGFFALYMKRYMHEFGVTEEQFAQVSVKNHKNGVRNPRAQYQKPVSLDDVMESRYIADPIKLLDCCPISDGASAVVLCPSNLVNRHVNIPIEIIASIQTTGHGSAADAFQDGYTTSFRATETAARRAYEMARIEPGDIDVVELHDCFTPAEIIDSEDLRFFDKGQGITALEDGITEIDGDLPINPSGGLLSKGHPVGATGLGQIYELGLQMRGTAENQVPDPEIALAHNMGGPGIVCTIHILKRG